MRKVLSKFFKPKQQESNLTKAVNMENAVNDFHVALRERDRALQRFDYSEASPDHIDAAIYEVKAAEARLSIALKEAKQIMM